MKKEYIKLDGTIVELELMQERAENICLCLEQDYFSLKNEDYILDQYNDARIKNDIVLDYLSQMESKLKELRDLMEDNKNDKAGV